MAFAGFPAEAFGFHERLELDNSRDFWAAHKGDYHRYVREPCLRWQASLKRSSARRR